MPSRKELGVESPLSQSFTASGCTHLAMGGIALGILPPDRYPPDIDSPPTLAVN